MIITCEECDTSFNLDDKVVKPSGSKVRCSQCRHVFTVHPSSGLAADQAGLPPQPATHGADAPAGGGAEAAQASAAGAVAAGGALSFDEEFDPGAERAFEKALEELGLEDDSVAGSSDMDLGEIENLLELEDDAGTREKRPAGASQTAGSAAEGQGASADDEGLDLSGLDELFDIPEEAEANEGGEHPVAAAEGQEAEPAEDEADEDEIIDLSDLEEMLDFEEDQDALEPQEVELTLSEDFGAEEDLSAIDEGGGEEDDLDLSDLESLLETDEAEGGDTDAATGDPQRGEAPEALDADGDDVELIDLSDVGGAFDDEGDGSSADGAETADADDLELELDFDSAADEDQEAAADGFELEFETDESKQAAGFGAAATAAVAAGGAATPVGAETPAEKGLAETRPAERNKVRKSEPYRAAAGAQKKGSGAPALILLLLILLIVGVLALQKFLGVHIPYVTDLTRSIPFIGEFVQPQGQVSDPAGNLYLSTLNINSRFIENDSAGRLFIITGEVKNGYTVARRDIAVNGKIYSQGKQLVKSENVVSGNILADLDLKNLSFEEIQGRLNTKGEIGVANLEVKPGATIPFMLVFSDLPENLEEFTIEVTGSAAVTAPTAN
ncbi:MAG: zinc-ribbon domain-containing protein [Desulfobacteraceae bacterium]|nr:zinc-ribbon domain-containing protein [Desulfobacteraceae bacterium]